MAIKTFKHKGLEKFFNTGSKSKISAAHAKKLALILDRLSASHQAQDMNFPGSNFHQLKGDLKNFYSVHVSGNYVVIFRFNGNDAYDVDYLDYH
jgi:proteic killer suppression protein